MKQILLLLALSLLPQTAQAQQYNGTSRWTWPGDLRRHLVEHGCQWEHVVKMDRYQLQATHDRIHDITQRGTPSKGDVDLIWGTTYTYGPGPSRSGLPVGNNRSYRMGASVPIQRPQYRPQPVMRSYSGVGIGVITPQGAAGIGYGRGYSRPYCPTCPQ